MQKNNKLPSDFNKEETVLKITIEEFLERQDDVKSNAIMIRNSQLNSISRFDTFKKTSQCPNPQRREIKDPYYKPFKHEFSATKMSKWSQTSTKGRKNSSNYSFITNLIFPWAYLLQPDKNGKLGPKAVVVGVVLFMILFYIGQLVCKRIWSYYKGEQPIKRDKNRGKNSTIIMSHGGGNKARDHRSDGPYPDSWENDSGSESGSSRYSGSSQYISDSDTKSEYSRDTAGIAEFI